MPNTVSFIGLLRDRQKAIEVLKRKAEHVDVPAAARNPCKRKVQPWPVPRKDPRWEEHHRAAVDQNDLRAAEGYSSSGTPEEFLELRKVPRALDQGLKVDQLRTRLAQHRTQFRPCLAQFTAHGEILRPRDACPRPQDAEDGFLWALLAPEVI